MDRLLVRPAEVADALGLSRSAVYDLIARGRLPCVRIGGSIRIPVSELQRWLQDRTTATAGIDDDSAMPLPHINN